MTKATKYDLQHTGKTNRKLMLIKIFGDGTKNRDRVPTLCGTLQVLTFACLQQLKFCYDMR